METAKNAANYVSESVKGTGHETSKEANKNVAKDSDVGIGSRASAAKDALKDKTKEEKHDAKADAHKEAAKH
ncbi:hypothetical protein N7509_014101 [Penicillium cosmopolitanum]|uniref:Glucose-repressible protein n=1 Tax=Penicillium cosmopolitanum TaxID=1131564 RepID=A0A9W9V6H5_9EURO|nr:uncharacterized protein N7509_014101 [Penicillium cosmopolitanum]KAJ5369489.1 hypothetical protein N7509_014101 [Penicillium cosmopolitanum]